MSDKVDTIELRWANRTVFSPSQTPRRFLDFIINGKSLAFAPGARGFIGVLGWDGRFDDYYRAAVDRLLLKTPANTYHGRVLLLVCPECADDDCGFVGARITRVGDKIHWTDFAREQDPNLVDLDEQWPLPGIGPFVFDAAEYTRVIKASATIVERPGLH